MAGCWVASSSESVDVGRVFGCCSVVSCWVTSSSEFVAAGRVLVSHSSSGVKSLFGVEVASSSESVDVGRVFSCCSVVSCWVTSSSEFVAAGRVLVSHKSPGVKSLFGVEVVEIASPSVEYDVGGALSVDVAKVTRGLVSVVPGWSGCDEVLDCSGNFMACEAELSVATVVNVVVDSIATLAEVVDCIATDDNVADTPVEDDNSVEDGVAVLPVEATSLLVVVAALVGDDVVEVTAVLVAGCWHI